MRPFRVVHEEGGPDAGRCRPPAYPQGRGCLAGIAGLGAAFVGFMVAGVSFQFLGIRGDGPLLTVAALAGIVGAWRFIGPKAEDVTRYEEDRVFWEHMWICPNCKESRPIPPDE